MNLREAPKEQLDKLLDCVYEKDIAIKAWQDAFVASAFVNIIFMIVFVASLTMNGCSK